MTHRKVVWQRIPPTNKQTDCICGGMKPGATGRILIMCPACDGVIRGKMEPCDCGDKFWDEAERK